MKLQHSQLILSFFSALFLIYDFFVYDLIYDLRLH